METFQNAVVEATNPVGALVAAQIHGEPQPGVTLLVEGSRVNPYGDRRMGPFSEFPKPLRTALAEAFRVR